MKFDKIMETSQSRTKAPTEDTVIEESRIIKDNAEIPLTEIEFYSDNNVAQPFKIDEEELNRLTESIKSMGQLTPATVRELDSGKYELLSGHKRYIALQRLGYKTILCRVCDFNNKEAFKAVCHANIQRKGEKPTEICNMFNGYRQRFGEDMSVTEMSTFFGVSPKTLYRCIHINNLIDELKPLVDTGMLSIHAVEIIDALNDEQQKVLFGYLKKVEKALTPKAAKQVIELADQNKDFTVDDIDKALNPPKIKKVYKSPVYNTIYSVEPLLIQGMSEQELDELVYRLLKQHMTEQQEGGNEATKPVRWDGKSMQVEVDTAVIRISRKYDIRRMLERNISAFDIATQLRNHCINTSYGTPDGEYTIFCGDTMLIKFTNRILNANGATRLELTWRQVADELIKLTELSMDNLKSE